jgi:C-3',4' desaturase CrtD
MNRFPHTVVIGAGVGGLTAAALLLRAGHRVTVLEAHVYPGGSAGTFYHQKYRFDAGATLAGGFSPGGPHARVAEILGLEWPIRPVDPAWVVHLPDGRNVSQWAGRDEWQTERRRHFPGTEPFWEIQERLAAIAWGISSRPFPWPPRDVRDLATLARALRPRTFRALPYLARPMGDLPTGADPLFRAFLDGQLLISAQTTAGQAGALYGSAALDLPRRGVNHVRGGIGALAGTLVEWIRAHGGQVLFRQRVTRIDARDGRARAIHTQKGLHLDADYVLANVTPWALGNLLGTAAPAGLTEELTRLRPTCGAFTLYVGLDAVSLPAGLADHYQIIVDPSRPLGEGNSVFLSLSDPDDPSRAPPGRRAATLSTHTAVAHWWRLRQGPDKSAYEARREEYAHRLLAAAEQAIPGFRRAVRLCLPGTPVTFAHYTGRPLGMVGGFAQKSLFAARGPRTGIANLWQVGDSIFPGQSTAGVTLGAMRVAAEVARAAND